MAASARSGARRPLMCDENGLAGGLLRGTRAALHGPVGARWLLAGLTGPCPLPDRGSSRHQARADFGSLAAAGLCRTHLRLRVPVAGGYLDSPAETPSVVRSVPAGRTGPWRSCASAGAVFPNRWTSWCRSASCTIWPCGQGPSRSWPSSWRLRSRQGCRWGGQLPGCRASSQI